MTRKDLKPRIGFCLQMLHLAWWTALSAAVNLVSYFLYFVCSAISDLVNSLMSTERQTKRPVEDRKPDHALRLLLHPLEEVEGLNQIAVSGLLEARPDAGVDVDPTEGLSLAEHSGHLDAVTEQQPQLPLV